MLSFFAFVLGIVNAGGRWQHMCAVKSKLIDRSINQSVSQTIIQPVKRANKNQQMYKTTLTYPCPSRVRMPELKETGSLNICIDESHSISEPFVLTNLTANISIWGNVFAPCRQNHNTFNFLIPVWIRRLTETGAPVCCCRLMVLSVPLCLSSFRCTAVGLAIRTPVGSARSSSGVGRTPSTIWTWFWIGTRPTSAPTTTGCGGLQETKPGGPWSGTTAVQNVTPYWPTYWSWSGIRPELADSATNSKLRLKSTVITQTWTRWTGVQRPTEQRGTVLMYLFVLNK